ncbi:MAG: YceD family protein [Propylenella sp.]
MKSGSLSLTARTDEIPAGGRRFRVEANAVERVALARELGIPEVTELTADLDVRALGGGAYSVRGALVATVVQTDVVTLDPVPQAVSEAIDLTLVAAESAAGAAASEPKESVGPDAFHGGRIALGAIVREYLALGLDPYPRAPGVEFPGHIEDDSAADASPLASLAKLKNAKE